MHIDVLNHINELWFVELLKIDSNKLKLLIKSKTQPCPKLDLNFTWPLTHV